MIGKIRILILFAIVAVCSCKTSKNLSTEKYDCLHDYSFGPIVYDTIDADFYYENRIEAYIITDAVIKSGGYIKAQKDVEESYSRGYYVISPYYLEKFSKAVAGFRYDSLSVSNFVVDQRVKAQLAGTLYGPTPINPYCGVYYKQYHLKIEAVELGRVKQIIPMFKSCEEMKSIKGRKYVWGTLPTYLVTRVFEAK